MEIMRHCTNPKRQTLMVSATLNQDIQELAKLAHEIADQVKASGESVKLRPMNAFERKVIHDTIQEIGLTSESEGEDPNRCVVVLPE